MKKSITYSFWFIFLFIAFGTFSVWANLFHPNSLNIDNSKTLAFSTEQKIPSTLSLKNIPETKKTAKIVVPKNVQTQPQVRPQPQVQAQTAPVAVVAPTSTRPTKTS